MIKVGLTGGIGSGKSTVGKMFAAHGIAVYDSDKEAKALMVSDPELIKGVTGLFGKKAYQDGKLDRAFISSRVFEDAALLRKLNGLVHPAVRRHFATWMTSQQGPYVIQEAAILFENGAYKEFDAMVLVWAPREVRIQRILARDGSTREDILARMRHQMTDTEKSALADFIIENIELEQTVNQVDNIHNDLLRLAAEQGN